MTDTIPDWAIEMALEAPNAIENIAMKWTVSEVKEARADLRYAASVMAHAAMIAKHEQPPVDPDEEALIRILQATEIGPDDMFPRAFARAVSQYKQEKANG